MPYHLVFFPNIRYDIARKNKEGIPVTEMETKRASRRLGWKGRLFLAVLVCAAVLAAFLLGASWGGQESKSAITSDLLGQQLRQAQELVSVEYHYTNMGKFENQVDFYGWKVPFTTKSFLVSYDGLIKAGVDLSQVQVNVDELSHTVTVTLPGGEIISHEIPEDSIQVFDETHNIFNPITIEDYTGFTQDQRQAVEQKAVDNGLLTAAEEKARAAVESFLLLIPGMEDYTLTVK